VVVRWWRHPDFRSGATVVCGRDKQAPLNRAYVPLPPSEPDPPGQIGSPLLPSLNRVVSRY